MGEEKESLAVVEVHKWTLVLPPRVGVLQAYVTLKFTNSLLDLVEVTIIVNKPSAPFKAASIQVQFDDPSEYIDFVLDLLAQLLNMFVVSEEHYEQHTYL